MEEERDSLGFRSVLLVCLLFVCVCVKETHLWEEVFRAIEWVEFVSHPISPCLTLFHAVVESKYLEENAKDSRMGEIVAHRDIIPSVYEGSLV